MTSNFLNSQQQIIHLNTDLLHIQHTFPLATNIQPSEDLLFILNLPSSLFKHPNQTTCLATSIHLPLAVEPAAAARDPASRRQPTLGFGTVATAAVVLSTLLQTKPAQAVTTGAANTAA